ncbi:hypothetical protein Pmani_037518 [Petrolisthes manimaculis]|uniref:Major facilitator superfamily (MFS) profile domain-containing protein n=1 Tax=Petrolisthes manimaculis TaxID=1843537 RepID=A0AAE1TLC5_9EUCA|nr:hypothetical protein Pmani_037518 [Petrolisthes manimaculis]
MGLLAAFLNAPSIVLPCEVSEATWRGTLARLLEVWVTLGFLLFYLMSGLISWKTAALLIPAITFISGILGLLIVPESPSWLYRRQREAEAFNSLLKIRNSRTAVEKEMVEMKMLDQQDTKKLSWHHLLKMIYQKDYVMSMVISVLVPSLAVFCGFGVVAIYLPEVFAMTGVSRDQYWSSVISGSFRLLFNFIGSGLLSRMRRKVMLVSGSFTALVGVASLGAFFYFKEQRYDMSDVSWLPLAAVVMYVAGISGGVLPPAWLVAAEVLPSNIRSFGMGITNTVYTTLYFLVSKTYDDTKVTLGPHGVFWAYS